MMPHHYVQLIERPTGIYIEQIFFFTEESNEQLLEAQIEAAVALMMRAMDGGKLWSYTLRDHIFEAWGIDVSVDSITGGNDALRAPLFRSMIRAAAVEGSFYVANDGSDEIFTIGIWFGPGRQMFST
jgi:hypothetical protein